MANVGKQISYGGSPSGRIPFIQYTPPTVSKPQPLIIFLHGQGEGSNTHNSTSVLTLQESLHGIFTLTKTANLPTFTSPTTGEQFQFYMLGPQLYYPSGVSSGILWPTPNYYITQLISYALNPSNGMNVDPKRIYLTGLSLGAGGTITALMDPNINKYIAAAAITCPGYGDAQAFFTAGGIGANIAKSGIPIKWYHARPDTTTNPSDGGIVSERIIRQLNAMQQGRQFSYVELVGGEYPQGGHQIWYVLYDLTPGTVNTTSGIPLVLGEDMWTWMLRYNKNDQFIPF